MELENADLRNKLQSLESRLNQVEKSGSTGASTAKATLPTPAPVVQKQQPVVQKQQPVASSKDDDDDVDLFGEEDEEESEEQQRLKAERLAAYEAKKSKKPVLIAKSSVTLDIKPWDDETDLKKLEESVRSIEMDGLLWGASKFIPVAYGVKKLQIICVVEDDKVCS